MNQPDDTKLIEFKEVVHQVQCCLQIISNQIGRRPSFRDPKFSESASYALVQNLHDQTAVVINHLYRELSTGDDGRQMAIIAMGEILIMSRFRLPAGSWVAISEARKLFNFLRKFLLLHLIELNDEEVTAYMQTIDPAFHSYP